MPAAPLPPRAVVYPVRNCFSFRKICGVIDETVVGTNARAADALDIVEHHADRAALLLDGRLAREWTNPQIEALRSSGGGFESALVG